VSRKSRRKADRSPLVEAMKSYVEFPWDYSYFKWQDIPAQVRREMVRNTSMFGRCWIWGRTRQVADVSKQAAREIYNENWNGCRDVWKENYRRRKLALYTDRPIEPPDPRLVEGERQYREREAAEHAKFNRMQQRC
jgi:hypothetical protein